MDKLKKTPITLTVTNAISYLMAIAFIISLLYSLLSYVNNGLYTDKAIYIAVYSCLCYIITSSLYYIVKASCIYIEKNEKE